MSRYFVQDTPLVAMERMMMEVPHPEKNGGRANHNTVNLQQAQNPRQEQTSIINGGAEENTTAHLSLNSG